MTDSPPTMARIIPARDFGKAVEAAAILENARSKQKMIKAACEEALANAHRQGLEEGRQAGLRELAKKLTGTLDRAQKDLLDIESEITSIVLRATALVIGELEPHDRINRIVRKALEEAVGERQVKLLVPEEDEAFIRTALDGLDPRVTVAPGLHMARGEMVIETATDRKHIGLAEQFAALMEALNRG